jgi:hypothetical protein
MVLVIMTLILGAILGSVHYVTEEPIAAQEKNSMTKRWSPSCR